jgi:hypothetical protein
LADAAATATSTGFSGDGEGGREARKKERVLVGEKQRKIKMLV